MDVACVQETRWRGSGCRFFGAIGKRYQLFWMGSKAKTDGVGIFVAEKWVDSVVNQGCTEYSIRAEQCIHIRPNSTAVSGPNTNTGPAVTQVGHHSEW